MRIYYRLEVGITYDDFLQYLKEKKYGIKEHEKVELNESLFKVFERFFVSKVEIDTPDTTFSQSYTKGDVE
jgi:hypothetical protein